MLNDEQKAYLEQVAKEKAEKAEEEADKGPKVPPTCGLTMLPHHVCVHPYSLPGEPLLCPCGRPLHDPHR